MEMCTCRSSPLIPLFTAHLPAYPKKLMETKEAFGMSLFS